MSLSDHQKNMLNRALMANYKVDLGGLIQEFQNVQGTVYSKIYIDALNTGTADGTEQKPFATLSAAVSAMASMDATGFQIEFGYGTYSEVSAVTFPNKPIVINGNRASITFTGGLTVPNSNFSMEELNTTGAIALTGTTAGTAMIKGEATISGNVTVSSGVYVDAQACVFSGGVITVNSGATFVGMIDIFTSSITGAGTIILENFTMNTSKSTALIASTSGGAVTIQNGIIVNSGTGGGVSCDNGNASGNVIGNSIITTASGAPVACGTTTLFYSKVLSSGGTNTGTGYAAVPDMIGAAIMKLGSDAKGDLYYCNTSGILTRLPIGTSGQTLKVSSSGIPEWTT